MADKQEPKRYPINMDMADKGGSRWFLEEGSCAICSGQTISPIMLTSGRKGGTEEPICSDCLIDLHKASHTKLTVHQRLNSLEARAERTEGKVDGQIKNLDLALIIALAVLSFIAGVVVGN